MKTQRIISFFIIYLAVFFTNAQTPIKDLLKQHVYTLASDSLQGRKAGTKHAIMASEYIVNQWKEIGVEPYKDSSYLQLFNDGLFQNIVGIIRGNDSILKNEYIIVGAHYDHLGVKNGKIYHGADDNASGVASLIELGRELKNNELNLKRSIILIAFDAEEIGLRGSRYFIDDSEILPKDIKLMLSVDMVGWYKASNKVKYTGTGTIKGGRKMIMNSQLVPAGLNVVANKFEIGRFGFGTTDTDPFAKKKIPTLAVTTGLKSPYHKPEDEAHLIDYDGIKMITEHLNNLVEEVSNKEDFKASGKVARKDRPLQRFMFGLSANIGTNYHHYTKGAINGKSATSFGAGLMAQVNMGYFAIRPEVYYDCIRAEHPAGIVATHNITVPVSIVGQLLFNKVVGVDLLFGGYYSHRLTGKQSKETLDFKNIFNRDEGGLTLGFGLFVKPFRIGFTSRIALTNFTKSTNTDNAYIKNRTNYFTITYIF
jgi:hypothetical protein